MQQIVAICRAIDLSAKVLILDEPTASLDACEVEMLFTLMRQLRDRGVSLIFVTHFLDQVYGQRPHHRPAQRRLRRLSRNGGTAAD